MTTCDGRRDKRRLLFALPPGIVAQFGVPAKSLAGTMVIDGVSHNLLAVFPDNGQYGNTDTYGEKPFRKGFGGYTRRVYRPFVDPEISINAILSAREYWALLRLQELSAQSNTVVTMLDYCMPNLADISTALAGQTDPFTVRRGTLQIEEQPTLRGGPDYGYFLEGTVAMMFQEIPL